MNNKKKSDTRTLYLWRYIAISFISFLIINKIWMMWEELKYGEIRPDNFDGLILYILSFLIAYCFYQRDSIKIMREIMDEIRDESILNPHKEELHLIKDNMTVKGE